MQAQAVCSWDAWKEAEEAADKARRAYHRTVNDLAHKIAAEAFGLKVGDVILITRKGKQEKAQVTEISGYVDYFDPFKKMTFMFHPVGLLYFKQDGTPGKRPGSLWIGADFWEKIEQDQLPPEE